MQIKVMTCMYLCIFPSVSSVLTAPDGSLEMLNMTNIMMHCLALDGRSSSQHQEEDQSFNTDLEKAKEINNSPRWNKVYTTI